jgi:hypothetical protein
MVHPVLYWMWLVSSATILNAYTEHIKGVSRTLKLTFVMTCHSFWPFVLGSVFDHDNEAVLLVALLLHGSCR